MSSENTLAVNENAPTEVFLVPDKLCLDEENPTEIKKHQLRRTKEEADKLELANARTRGELVEVAKVKRLGEQVMSGIKTKILNMPLTDDEKDKCLRDLLSMKDLDYSDK